MNGAKGKSCASYKPVEKDFGISYKNDFSSNCKDCVYFSSRNCGMEAADSISDFGIFF